VAEPSEPVTLTDRCADTLRREIAAGRLVMPKGFLTESKLCKRFGVSRITIRRSLALLCEEGLLLNVPYKGYVLGSAARAHGQAARPRLTRNRDRVLFVKTPSALGAAAPWHMGLVIESARQEAAERGLRFEIVSQSLPALLRQLKAELRDRLLGVALEWYDRNVAEALLSEGVPTVLVEYHHEGLLQDGIIQDNTQGTHLAVDHVWALGHRKIGLIGRSSGPGLYHSLARRTAFVTRMLHYGQVEPAPLGLSERFDAEGGRLAAQHIFERWGQPTALVIAHLEMAGGVFDELEARGLRPGEDVSVVAWGTPDAQAALLSETTWKNFSLDLVNWSREEMGRMVVRMLLARHLNPLIPVMHEAIPAGIVKQGSCRAPKAVSA